MNEVSWPGVIAACLIYLGIVYILGTILNWIERLWMRWVFRHERKRLRKQRSKECN